MKELFKLRWESRDRALQKEFIRVRQEMNSKGILNSSTTIQIAYDAIVAEFKACRLIISQIIIEHIKQSNRIANAKDFDHIAQDQLSARKLVLEQNLESTFANVIKGLNNVALIAPFRNLNSQYELFTRELTIELKNAITEHNKSFGNSLTVQIKTQFLNNPILAVIILSIAVATFVIGFIQLLGF